ncbi:MAG: hypothetical protein M3072_17755 [Candidatus Dormibacteraeota bacterium]|nr:hypothetical protein [Candidatus Dormibacteraeota bacterium]
MKARVALDEDPGGQLIIRREGTRIAFVVLDFPRGSFTAAAAPLGAAETHWRGKAWLDKGAQPATTDRRMSPIDLRQRTSGCGADRSERLVAM